MHIAVMGAGSLGCLIGGLLATEHRVTLVGRDDRMRPIAKNGLRITGEFDRTAHPAVTTDWGAVEDPDVGIVTVKSYDTIAAAEEMGINPPSTTVTLQNGLGNVPTLRNTLEPPSSVLLGTATYGARLEAPGEVRCTGRGHIFLGAPDGGASVNANQIATAWRQTPLDCTAAEDMPRRQWKKLAVNAGINPVTALSGIRNGRILEDPIRPIAVAATREVARVARTRGHDVDIADTIATMETVARATRANESSMARDVRRGLRTEIEAINGAVIAQANPAEVPVNRVLYGLIVGYELGVGLRSGAPD